VLANLSVCRARGGALDRRAFVDGSRLRDEVVSDQVVVTSAFVTAERKSLSIHAAARSLKAALSALREHLAGMCSTTSRALRGVIRSHFAGRAPP
jgi:hypothetical protein